MSSSEDHEGEEEACGLWEVANAMFVIEVEELTFLEMKQLCQSVACTIMIDHGQT